MKPLAKVRILSDWPQTNQIVTGLCMLHRQGAIRLRWMPVADRSIRPVAAIVEVETGGRRVAFDMSDGYNFDRSMYDSYLDGCDALFKRSFSREMNAGLRNAHKMFPLGFNYNVVHRCAPADRSTRLKNLAKRVLPGRNPEWAIFNHRRFEFRPRVTTPPRIIFAARLWAPDLDDPALNREREEINATRVAIIRRLRRLYGEQFTGGLYDNPIARILAPELILPDSQTDRVNYLKTMHRCDICVASTGLHGSIGWKMGEYVAAGRAIVTERMLYEVPGDYTEGRHYLSFDTPDECLAHIDRLADDPSLRLEMMTANHDYYNRWLRPDRLVANALFTHRT